MQRIDCEGAPRDLGLTQGVACRRVIRERVDRCGISTRRRPLALLQPLASGPVLAAGAGREVLRHYPHLAERMAGIARGSGLSLDAVMALLVREPQLSASASADEPAFVAGVRGSQRTSLAVRVPGEAARFPWILRRSRPEVGFPSAELTLPWLASSVAGVNAEGLAAAITPAPSPAAREHGPGATAALLVQECLQRFGEVDPGLDWCLKRPAIGNAWIVLADASGCIAAVEFSGRDRRVHRAVGGVIVQGERAGLAEELRKQIIDGEIQDAAGALARDAGDAVVAQLSSTEARLALVDPNGTTPGAELAAA